MLKKIVTITLNPAYDLIGNCQNFQKNSLNLINNKGLYPAGKGINVAKVLRKLEVPVEVSGLLGSENSLNFEKLFKEINVNNHFYSVKGSNRINVKITEEDGDLTEFNFSGFTISSDNWKNFIEYFNSTFKEPMIICISGSLPQGLELNNFIQWVESLTQKNHEIILDSSSGALREGVNKKPFLIKPNLFELEQLLDKKLNTLEEVQFESYKLIQKGISHIVISLGKEGAMWVSEKESFYATPPKVTVVSSVGAGDCMLAGIISSLYQGKSIKESLKSATALASLSVQSAKVDDFNKKDWLLLQEEIKIFSLSENPTIFKKEI